MRPVLGADLRAERQRRKLFGQYFTPDALSLLACAAAGVTAGSSVVDPMCGDGSMLRASLSLASLVEGSAHVLGIEIDPTVRVAAPPSKVTVHIDDAFAHFAGLGRAEVAFGAGAFDAVVGNPPYVRYQALRALYRMGEQRTLERLDRVWGTSTRGSDVVRSLLLMLADSLGSLGPEDRLAAAISSLKGKSAIEPVDALEAEWVAAVTNYSGLSDLSVPAWLLAWKLVRPGGRIGFVSPKAWERRQYGGVLRDFFQAATDPVLMIEPDRPRWFSSAQVTTALIVVERRQTPWTGGPRPIRSVQVTGLVDMADPGALAPAVKHIAQSQSPPEAARSWVQALLDGVNVPGTIAATSPWPPSDVVRHVVMKGQRAPAQELGRLWQQLDSSSVDLGYSPHQGLRTGCNEFFYVRRMTLSESGSDAVSVQLSSTFGHDRLEVPRNWLRPTIRRQAGLPRCGGRVEGPSDDLALVISDSADLPEALVQYIDRAAATELVRNGAVVRIPDLSAVRTRFNGQERRAKRTRAWFQLPLMPRHDAEVFAPRVNATHLRAFLNPNRQLIDANFSTLVAGEKVALSPSAMVLLLNSDAVRAVMETIATPLGGGALKVEAAHLRELRLPRLAVHELRELETIAASMDHAGETGRKVTARANAVIRGAAATQLQVSDRRLSGLIRGQLSRARAWRRVP